MNKRIIAERIVKKILAARTQGTFAPYRGGITLSWAFVAGESDEDAAKAKYREFSRDYLSLAKKFFPDVRIKLKPGKVQGAKAKWGSWVELYIMVDHDDKNRHPYMSNWSTDVYPLYKAMEKRGWKWKVK